MRPGEAREEFLAGRVLLRLLLAAFLRCAPPDVPLALDANGKPCLPENAGLHLNLAHSQGLVVVALSRSGPVGVDLEYRNPAFSAAEAVELAAAFAPEELARLKQLPPAEQPDAFYTLWTAKEALAKADGRGLLLPLQTIPAPAGCAQAETALQFDGGSFYVRHLQHLPAFPVALAHTEPDQALVLLDAHLLVRSVTPITLPRGDREADASGIVQSMTRL